MRPALLSVMEHPNKAWHEQQLENTPPERYLAYNLACIALEERIIEMRTSPDPPKTLLGCLVFLDVDVTDINPRNKTLKEVSP